MYSVGATCESTIVLVLTLAHTRPCTPSRRQNTQMCAVFSPTAVPAASFVVLVVHPAHDDSLLCGYKIGSRHACEPLPQPWCAHTRLCTPSHHQNTQICAVSSELLACVTAASFIVHASYTTRLLGGRSTRIMIVCPATTLVRTLFNSCTPSHYQNTQTYSVSSRAARLCHSCVIGHSCA
jgi:hypothetical protein